MDLSDLSLSSFWKNISNEEESFTPLVVILPSGRAKLATSGHLALISDALYTPEIVQSVDHLSREAGLDGVKVHSLLDIDFYEIMKEREDSGSTPSRKSPYDLAFDVLEANLLVLATADINIVTKLLLEECKSEESYGIGFRKPYEACMICGGEGRHYAVTAFPNIGVLTMYELPWAVGKKRVGILCGGVMAPGTLGASLLLLRYLRGAGSGNNTYNQQAPVKIVSSSIRDYRFVDLLPTAECTPNHELRNVLEDIKIHE